MTLGEQRVEQRLVHQSIGTVLGALTTFVAHHILLVGELGLIEHFRQKAHAIAFDPQRQLQLIGRHGLEVVGAIKVCRAIDLRCARAFEDAEVLIFWDVL